MMISSLLEAVLYLCLLLASAICLAAVLFVSWHRWKYPRSNDRVMAFFHPFCGAGGGGERVLWAILQALGELDQQGLAIKEVAIYTIDPPSESYKNDLLEKANERFSLAVPATLNISFVHLNDCAHYLDRAPRLSLLVESWGTMKLAYVALVRSSTIPKVFCDTTGCAFTYIVARLVFGCKVMAYVHYPTISTDMLSMVWERRRATYNNQAYIANSRITTFIKLMYYTMFAVAYGCAGSLCSLVLVNSTWTIGHIQWLWWFMAFKDKAIHVLFPPCRISSSERTASDQSQSSQQQSRERIVLSIGQFRHEKDHELQLEALSLLFQKHPTLKGGPGGVQMVMVGGCRGPSDQERLRHLQDKARALNLLDDNDDNSSPSVLFVVNQPYSVVEEWLSRASVGIHSMWNEHFGIGVVEMMSAGLITIAHNSGGPKSDIVVPFGGHATGMLAATAEEFADAMHQAFTMNKAEADSMRKHARLSAARFSDERFQQRFKSLFLESEILLH